VQVPDDRKARLRQEEGRFVSIAISVSNRSAVLTCSRVSVSAELLPIAGRRPPLQLQNASKIWYHWLNRDGVIGFLELRADRG